MQAYTVPDVQQTFGWGLDPECKERMLKLMDEAKHDDHVHSSLPPREYLRTDYPKNRAEKKNDPVEHPNHYVMPDGSETLSITRWLNNNGGQAVGYITRVCRIDGVVKGNAVEDLEKAIFLLRDEVDRLKSLEANDA